MEQDVAHHERDGRGPDTGGQRRDSHGRRHRESPQVADGAADVLGESVDGQ